MGWDPTRLRGRAGQSALVQRGTQCGQPAVERSRGGGYYPGVSDVTVHKRLGVVHLDGNTGGRE